MSNDKPIYEHDCSKDEKIETIKSVIKCIHRIWYKDWPKDPVLILELHQHMGALFNFAGITETLCENNPGELTPEEALKFVNNLKKLNDAMEKKDQ